METEEKLERYMHVEKIASDEVGGLFDGMVHVFPKIDGTNGSVWLDSGGLRCGSRNRVLSLLDDNQGFMEHVLANDNILNLLIQNPKWKLYGEWLVPHTFKAYRDNAWKKFYVFDVKVGEEFLPYNDYWPALVSHDVDFIPCQTVAEFPTFEGLLEFELPKANFLVEDGKGPGEGLVLKRYGFVNSHGRTAWAKIVRSEFKDAHSSNSKPSIHANTPVELEMCDQFYKKDIPEKVFAKIKNDGGWQSKKIPELLHRSYYDFFTEELWTAVKKMKNPTVDFKRLNRLVIERTKTYLPEVFS